MRKIFTAYPSSIDETIIASAEQSSDILSVVYHSDEPTKLGDNVQDVYEQDPKFWDTFTASLHCLQRYETDKRMTWRLFADVYYNNYYTTTFKESGDCPVDETEFWDKVEKLKSRILEYFENKLEDKQYRANLKKSGKRRFSAQAYTHKVIKDMLGVSPAFSFSDTGKSQYMLYDLPFTSSGELDYEEGEKFAHTFRSILTKLSDDLGFEFRDVRTPLGGSRVRSCFEFKVYGPDVLYDKATGEVEIDPKFIEMLERMWGKKGSEKYSKYLK